MSLFFVLVAIIEVWTSKFRGPWTLHIFGEEERAEVKELTKVKGEVQADAKRMTLSRCFSATTIDPIPTSDLPQFHLSYILGSDSQSLVVVSFYKIADFPDHANLRKPFKQLCQDLYVSGGIILVPEGINGSIWGTRESVERVIGFIQTDDRLKGLRRMESPVSPEQEAIHQGHSGSSPLAAGEDVPFRWDHVRVKLKKEIVTLGMPNVSLIEKGGKYVSPKDWNALISDPDTEVEGKGW